MATLTRDDMARMCANAHMSQEARINYRGYEIFVADGFSQNPEITFQKFGVEKDKYPDGAYGTLWGVAYSEDHFKTGGLLVAERNHDPHITDKKKARINAGIKEAKAFIDSSWRIANQGNALNG